MGAPREAIRQLERQRDLIETLRGQSPYSEAFRKWHQDTAALIAEAYGGSKQAQQAFQDILYTPLFLSCRGGDTVFEEAYRDGLQAAVRLLETLTEALAAMKEG